MLRRKKRGMKGRKRNVKKRNNDGRRKRKPRRRIKYPQANKRSVDLGSITIERFFFNTKEETRVFFTAWYISQFSELTIVTSISDYQRYFQPFHIRQDVIVAPYNQFIRDKSTLELSVTLIDSILSHPDPNLPPSGIHICN